VRVLLVSSGLPPRGHWGTEHYTRHLATGLARRGHELAVVVPRSDVGGGAEVVRADADGFELHMIPSSPRTTKRLEDSYADPALEQAFGGLVDAWRPDVVHFLHLLWRLSAQLPGLCRQRGIPALFTATDLGLACHRGQMFDWRLRACGGPHPAEVCARCIREPSPFDDRPTRVLLKRWAVRLAHALGGLGVVVRAADVRRREAALAEAVAALELLIAPTRAVEEVLLRAGVPRGKLERLLYSIDAQPLVAARAAPPLGPVRIGFLGQFAPHKGLGTLVEAVRIASSRLPESAEPWEVHLHGEGEAGRHRTYPDRILKQAQTGVGRPPRLCVHPPFASLDLPRVLAGLDCVVVPSEWLENAPLVALEARAAGVWLLASAVPGLREIVEVGVHADLFPPGDARALADALREVILRRRGRSAAPGLPLSYDEHLAGVEACYQRARARACGATEVVA